MRCFSAAFLVSALLAEKQLEAAQKFLRGILSLTSYEEVRDKQAQGIGKALEKAGGFTAAQAASWLGLLEADLWSSSQLDCFRETVAGKTLPLEVDTCWCDPRLFFTASLSKR